MTKRCIVCNGPKGDRAFLCGLCGISYDRAVAKDETTANIIRWAATRARLFVRSDRLPPSTVTDLRGTTIEPAPTDPNRPRAKR